MEVDKPLLDRVGRVNVNTVLSHGDCSCGLKFMGVCFALSCELLVL